MANSQYMRVSQPVYGTTTVVSTGQQQYAPAGQQQYAPPPQYGQSNNPQPTAPNQYPQQPAPPPSYEHTQVIYIT